MLVRTKTWKYMQPGMDIFRGRNVWWSCHNRDCSTYFSDGKFVNSLKLSLFHGQWNFPIIYPHHFFQGETSTLLSVATAAAMHVAAWPPWRHEPGRVTKRSFHPKAAKVGSLSNFSQFSIRAFGSSGPKWPIGILVYFSQKFERCHQKGFQDHTSYPNNTWFKFIPCGSPFWNIPANTLRGKGGISKKGVGYMLPHDIEWLHVWVCLRNSLHQNSETWMDWDVLSQFHRQCETSSGSCIAFWTSTCVFHSGTMPATCMFSNALSSIH